MKQLFIPSINYYVSLKVLIDLIVDIANCFKMGKRKNRRWQCFTHNFIEKV